MFAVIIHEKMEENTNYKKTLQNIFQIMIVVYQITKASHYENCFLYKLIVL